MNDFLAAGHDAIKFLRELDDRYVELAKEEILTQVFGEDDRNYYNQDILQSSYQDKEELAFNHPPEEIISHPSDEGDTTSDEDDTSSDDDSDQDDFDDGGSFVPTSPSLPSDGGGGTADIEPDGENTNASTSQSADENTRGEAEIRAK